jgi:hypothetical protein
MTTHIPARMASLVPVFVSGQGGGRRLLVTSARCPHLVLLELVPRGTLVSEPSSSGFCLPAVVLRRGWALRR